MDNKPRCPMCDGVIEETETDEIYCNHCGHWENQEEEYLG